jgi:hypothetical protein
VNRGVAEDCRGIKISGKILKTVDTFLAHPIASPFYSTREKLTSSYEKEIHVAVRLL